MILIIEDESTNLFIGTAMIRKACPKELILQFMDPEECFRHFAKRKQLPDVIFCDFNLPHFNGGDVYDFFKAKGFEGEFYIISSEYDLSKMASPLENPGVGFIRKPVLSEDFKKALSGR